MDNNLPVLKKGDYLVVKVSKRMAEKAPALKPYIGKNEWFTIKSNGPIVGVKATWDLHPMVELTIQKEEIVSAKEHFRLK